MTQVPYRRRRRTRRRKKTMPPLAYLLLLLAAVAVVLLIVIAAAGGSSEEPEATQPSSVAPSEEPSVGTKPIPAGWVQIDPSVLDGSVGDLALVNAQYGIEPDAALTDVFSHKTNSYYVKDTELSVDKRVMQPLNDWMDAFEKATGLNNINIVAGFRTKEYQQKLYDNSVANKGAVYAQQYIAQPGHSEHHTGLAIDLDTYFPDTGASGGFDGADKYAWAVEHAWEFGFVRRYPEYKAQITGISYEPWHFRYVGVVHAYTMQKEKLCLEEYIALLHEHTFDGEHLTVQCQGSTYEIYSCPEDRVVVPQSREYTICSDNTGNYIVTVGGK